MAFRDHLGASQGAPWGVCWGEGPGGSWGALGASRGDLRAILENLEGFFGVLEVVFKNLWALLGRPWIDLGTNLGDRN